MFLYSVYNHLSGNSLGLFIRLLYFFRQKLLRMPAKFAKRWISFRILKSRLKKLNNKAYHFPLLFMTSELKFQNLSEVQN